jgi:hypothetical protein
VRFYLGTHKTQWLGFPQFVDVPLFISHRALAVRARMPRAVTRWSLDSGGFTELSMYGEWRTPPGEYVDAVYRYTDEIGRLDWASPQDWMCEDVMLAKTGLTVEAHQKLTVESVCQLRAAAPDLPFIPVLQGQAVDDYLDHVEQYAAAGIDLRAEPIVGVGSVCRRQATAEIGELVTELAATGLALHGFGVKKAGLLRYGQHLASADSMAWSFSARYEPPMAGHTHKACQNCPTYALAWRDRILPNLKEN